MSHPNIHTDAKTCAKSDWQATSIVHTYNAVIVKDAIKWGIRILALTLVLASSCGWTAVPASPPFHNYIYLWPCMCAVYFKPEHSKQKCLSRKKDCNSRQEASSPSSDKFQRLWWQLTVKWPLARIRDHVPWYKTRPLTLCVINFELILAIFAVFHPKLCAHALRIECETLLSELFSHLPAATSC